MDTVCSHVQVQLATSRNCKKNPLHDWKQRHTSSHTCTITHIQTATSTHPSGSITAHDLDGAVIYYCGGHEPNPSTQTGLTCVEVAVARDMNGTIPHAQLTSIVDN